MPTHEQSAARIAQLEAEVAELRSRPTQDQCNAANEAFAMVTLARWEDAYQTLRAWRSDDWQVYTHLANRHASWLAYVMRQRKIVAPRGPHSLNNA